MLNVNSELDFEKAEEIAMEFDRLVEMEEQVDVIEYELVPEDWGGSTIFCPVSAHTGEGIDELLDMVSRCV